MLRKISLFFLLLFVSCITRAADNSIVMSYNTMTVYQQIVLSAGQQAGGTFTFSVQAKDGGGRGPPNYPSDIANLSIQYYNSSGALLATSTSNNSTTYGEATYRTYTLTSTNCGGAGCTNVAWLRVNMTGNDGGFWAGNHGTNFVSPELTFTPTGGSASTNILYNPEFGVNGTYTSTSAPHGWWNSTNAWGGNTRPQLVNNGATVNSDAGGFSANGGTLSGTAGGYVSAPPAPVYSSGITNAQETRKNAETTQRLNQSGNEIQIEQIGDNNTITIRQGVTLGAKNRIELYSNGDSNTYNLNQGYTTNGTAVSDSGNHYMYLNVTGSNNTVTKQQTGTTNFTETTVSGNTNNLTNIQQGNSPKILFQNINGNNNTVTTNQKDGGQHYLDINLTGNGHSVNATQEGAGNHAATIQFTNSGGASSLNLNQSGSTNQTYSINQSCTNPAGCSTTITQP